MHMVSAGSINVAVRVRPPTSWEAARLPEPIYDTTIRSDGTLAVPNKASSMSSVREIVQVVDDRILTFDPAETDQTKAFVERGFLPPGTKRYKDKRFMFDRVFSHDSSQQDVYDGTARPLLRNLLDGYNATVFAYGATGCGKTHTISGAEGNPGIIYLTMADLFQRIEERKEDHVVEVVVTFLEIYNEEIRDLLAEPGTPTPRGGLQIREDKSVKVVGLTELRPKTADEVKDIVLMGNSRRTQSPTHANETSSRSHAVLQVHVTQAPRTASVTEERTVGTLSIIDLAGSERAAATTNMGQRMVEGANINKSLLALGNCINALCESGGAVRHVPYRNSKLTRLLKFSLGGNCKTVMIVCVAPTSLHFDDTHNTLIYAERATKIKTRVVTRNVVNVDRHVGQYVEAINRLNIEVAELKAKLAGKLGTEADIARRKKLEAQAEVQRAKADMEAKANQTQASILDGASCAGRISAAHLKLRAIQSRLQELEKLAKASAAGLSPDLEAERGLLKALAAPEEQIVRLDSVFNARLQRSGNSSSMFDAMLRAVTERRSDRLDDTSVENVKLDARWRKAEMEKVKAEAERDAVRETMESQARMLVHLLGMVGRYTVVMDDAGRSLRTALDEGRDGLDGTARTVSASLKSLAERSDEDFQSIIGHSVASYATAASKSTLETFTGHPRVGRVSSVPAELPHMQNKPTRRSSSYGAVGLGSPSRKGHIRSPRKSNRASLSSGSAPYRRPSDKGKEKKGVQWKDEAGQGSLDDRGTSSSSSRPSIAITPATEECNFFGPPRNPGSESDWEDEKTDDSVNFSLASLPSRDLPPSRPSVPRTRRGSRLDPGFLKSRGQSTLTSLAEDDEGVGSPRRRGAGPLSDRSMNSFPSEGSSSGGSSSGGGKLHIPKGSQERNNMSSPRRHGQPPTPRAVGGTVKAARRRSNIGPMRSEKGRRRSSLIPQLSPKAREELNRSTSAPRRVAIGEGTKSPGKRGKRMSLLGPTSRNLPRLRPMATTSVANTSVGDVSISADGSFRAKPLWK
ncbi:kinesin-domain-containing protein [Amylostereum chailletii]|nr:kinesin-domain-containing protein [Amylostereum chailletii]